MVGADPSRRWRLTLRRSERTSACAGKRLPGVLPVSHPDRRRARRAIAFRGRRLSAVTDDARHQQRSAATLHDVAREAGVSLATASRVLNGSARKVAESYRERVEEAAARLGYTANLSAQATARGTSAIIALLVADIADPYFGQLAAGVARGADEAGLVVTIAITERDAEREARLVRALRGQRPQGLILAASRTEDEDGDGVRAELDAFGAMGGTGRRPRPGRWRRALGRRGQRRRSARPRRRAHGPRLPRRHHPRREPRGAHLRRPHRGLHRRLRLRRRPGAARPCAAASRARRGTP